jgi:hypothetical protein
MLLALMLATAAPDWVPARWYSNDPKSLELVAETPINCLLLERVSWSEAFATAAAKRGIGTLGVIHPGGDAVDQARQAVVLKLNGVALEGDFDPKVAAALKDSKILTVELPSRANLQLDDRSMPVLGTYQGLWPGLQIQENGAAKAAPSGAPWIDTNTGFLRFLHAYADRPVWIANLPPPKTVIPPQRYLQAIGDAAISGARWVVALDADFNSRLLAGDAKARSDWKRMGEGLRFYESHKEWRTLQPHATLALVEDAGSGALLSGGVLDMIAVKHTPVRPVPQPKLTGDAMKDAKMAVDVDPASLNPAQKEILRNFTRAGGTLLSAPPGWKFPMPATGEITLGKDDFAKLDDIWKELNSMTGHNNLGARLFNVSSMLSNLVGTPDGKRVVLHLVNYTDYPVEAITAHVLGAFQHARLYTPDAAPVELQTYTVEEGTGVDIDKIKVLATLVLE